MPHNPVFQADLNLVLKDNAGAVYPEQMILISFTKNNESQ
jgi:hypothetical protein